MPAPVLFAPVGVQTLAHPDGDLASARAAAELGLTYVHSTQGAYKMEEVAAANGDGSRWYQLYWPTDDELAVVHRFLLDMTAVIAEHARAIADAETRRPELVTVCADAAAPVRAPSARQVTSDRIMASKLHPPRLWREGKWLTCSDF